MLRFHCVCCCLECCSRVLTPWKKKKKINIHKPNRDNTLLFVIGNDRHERRSGRMKRPGCGRNSGSDRHSRNRPWSTARSSPTTTSSASTRKPGKRSKAQRASGRDGRPSGWQQPHGRWAFLPSAVIRVPRFSFRPSHLFIRS